MFLLRNWEFCRKFDCPDREPESLPTDQRSVRQRLAQHRNDASKMRAMRAMLSQHSMGMNISRLSDDGVIDQIASLLFIHAIHIHAVANDFPGFARQSPDSDANDDDFPTVPASMPSGGSKGPVPGNLKVAVLDAKTGKPIVGANVDITGPDPSSGNLTGNNGVVEKDGITPGAYSATAKHGGYTTENGSATVVSGATAKMVIKLTQITVTIRLGQPVACPGHPLDITATGIPAGGTFAWTIAAPTAKLVDGAGAPVSTGATVNLLGFHPDDTTGNIPEETASITVTYTYTNGEQATASQDVKIHKIDFVVTNDTITPGLVLIQESPASVKIGGYNATNRAVKTDPTVEIQLDATCPRKADCAGNHHVGWLQTMQSSDWRVRFRDSIITVVVVPPTPIRDSLCKATEGATCAAATFPFYGADIAFTGDRNQKIAHHEDSPNVWTGWTDPRPDAPAPPPQVNRQLRQVFFNNTFNAWLVVQNVEWSLHDMKNSFAFLRNFYWSVHLDVTVDTTQAVGSRCTPMAGSVNVNAPANPAVGKGGSIPVLTIPHFNAAFIWPPAVAVSPPV
jgi:hypothetical protein